MRISPRSILYRAVHLLILLCAVSFGPTGCMATADDEGHVGVANQALGQYVWNAAYLAEVEPSTLELRIGMSPVGAGHTAGAVYSINGGSWSGANAVWLENQPGAYGGQDEIWGVTIHNLSKGDTVRYALWGSLGSGQIWDNNNWQNFTTVVKDWSPPVFDVPRSYFDYSWALDVGQIIDHRTSLGFRPGQDAIITGIGVSDASRVTLVQACSSVDGWLSVRCVPGQALTGRAAGKYGSSWDVTYYQFDLGKFGAGAHVELYLEAVDDSGNHAWLPSDYDNFSFDVEQVPGSSVHPTRVRHELGHATIDLRVGPIGPDHTAGIAYCTGHASSGSCDGGWQEKGASWVRNEEGFEVWRVEVPLGSAYRIELAAFAQLGANAPRIWDNNLGRNYVTTPTPWFANWIRDFEHGRWLPIHWMSACSAPADVHIRYGFDDPTFATTGVVTDDSGHGFDAQLVGTPESEPGRTGGAISFDGTASIVAATNPTAGFGQLTVSLWFKTDAPATNYKIASAATWSGPAGSGWVVGTHYPEAWAADGSSLRSAPWNDQVQYFTAGAWNHVAFTYSGDRFQQYVNGDLVYDSPSSGKLIGAGQPLQIGAWPPYSAYNFVGLVDDVRIYQRALSTCEVQALAR